MQKCRVGSTVAHSKRQWKAGEGLETMGDIAQTKCYSTPCRPLVIAVGYHEGVLGCLEKTVRAVQRPGRQSQAGNAAAVQLSRPCVD